MPPEPGYLVGCKYHYESLGYYLIPSLSTHNNHFDIESFGENVWTIASNRVVTPVD